MKKITLPTNNGSSTTFFLSEYKHFVVEGTISKDKCYLNITGSNNGYLIDLSPTEVIQLLSKLFCN